MSAVIPAAWMRGRFASGPYFPKDVFVLPMYTPHLAMVSTRRGAVRRGYVFTAQVTETIRIIQLCSGIPISGRKPLSPLSPWFQGHENLYLHLSGLGLKYTMRLYTWYADADIRDSCFYAVSSLSLLHPVCGERKED